MKKNFYLKTVLFILIFSALMPQMIYADQFKVLVVFSYEETYPWDQEIKATIDEVLAETCEIKYFYMDTKKDVKAGPQKAEEAYKLYQEFQPDGVITADDNAQSMFVVPYLKNKVKTPVMFCGVNDEAETYGYPASNVSGILQRYHISESIALAQQIDPSIKTVGFMVRGGPTADAILKQVKSEAEKYSAKVTAFKTPKTLKQTLQMAEELKKTSDLLCMMAMPGIIDDNGASLTDKDVMPLVAKIFNKPTITAADYEIKYGLLCAMLLTGKEQGETAAKMLLKAMIGTPVSKIPITQNYQGKPMINVSVLKELGLKPDPAVLHSAELVRTEL